MVNDYIKSKRIKVGHDTIILNFSDACITNDKGEVLLQKRSDKEELWGLPGGATEIGESVEEAVIRAVKDHTGLDVVVVEHLIGVYSKYFTAYPNGDRTQSICCLFKCNITGGDLIIDNKGTFELRFFDENNAPKLFIKQNTDMLNDFFGNKIGVIK